MRSKFVLLFSFLAILLISCKKNAETPVAENFDVTFKYGGTDKKMKTSVVRLSIVNGSYSLAQFTAGNGSESLEFFVNLATTAQNKNGNVLYKVIGGVNFGSDAFLTITSINNDAISGTFVSTGARYPDPYSTPKEITEGKFNCKITKVDTQ